MSKVITYEEGSFSQIKLDSGERIMLSVAQTGMVIFKMRFFGLVPGPKIAEWSTQDLSRFMLLFGGAPQNQTPFKNTVDKLSSFDSIQSLRAFLNQDSNPFELAYQRRVQKEVHRSQTKHT